MVRAKGLDDLFLLGGSPRFRRRFAVPQGVAEHRPVLALPERGAVSGGGTLNAAREETTRAIESFVRDPSANRGRALLVTSAPGTGKSTALSLSVKRHRVEARLVVGTKVLAREQAASFGYNLIAGRNRSNCERYDVVRALGEAGHPVEALACGTPFEPRCPFRDSCPYFAQFARSGPRVGTTEQMFNGLFWKGGTLAVVDDGDLPRALIERLSLNSQALQTAVEQLDGGDYQAEREVLQVARHALVDAPTAWQSGGAAWDLLAAAAASKGLEFASLVEAIPSRAKLPGPFVDADGYVSVRTVEAVPPASASVLLRALKEELPAFRSSEDFNSRIRISQRCLEVGQLRQHISDRDGTVIARLPLLVLDATPVTSLVDHLTTLHERLPDVTGEIALPANVTVVQYATGTNGHTSLRAEQHVQRVIEEIENERRIVPCSAEDEAIVLYKGALPRFARAGFAASRQLTMGAARGTNILASVRRLHVVGRPHPPPDETFYLAQIIHHDEPPVSPEVILIKRSFGGQPHGVEVVDYADPRMADLLHAAREDELLQVLHRARLLTLEPQAQMDTDQRSEVHLVIHTSHPVPGLRVDRLVLGSPLGNQLNLDRQQGALKRIEGAVQRLEAEGRPVTVEVVARAAGASWRTVRKHLGTSLHTPVDARAPEAEVEDLRTTLHTSVDEGTKGVTMATRERTNLGTKLHTPYIDFLGGVQNVPQAPERALGGSRAHWEPCRGGCGTAVPPGQKCFDCAAQAVAAWKASQRGARVAS